MNNPKVRTPPTVKIHKGIVYSITINPNDKKQYYQSPKVNYAGYKDRLKAFKRGWHNLFTEMFSLNETDYYLCIECSEPLEQNNPPRLHFHGWIRFNSIDAINEFLLINMRALQHVSNINIDMISDQQYWYDYCHKQEQNGYGCLENMPPNIDNIFDFMSLPGFVFLSDDSDDESLLDDT